MFSSTILSFLIPFQILKTLILDEMFSHKKVHFSMTKIILIARAFYDGLSMINM
ncbi:hypothetical protein WN944_013443 [Citrus x changshan-huyou]|uniref:Uncharacterized protein n=1 Tax=Citrus x changshan-huyou TaxID=2935761 RepID=A0AAP0QKI6_9ROSI